MFLETNSVELHYLNLLLFFSFYCVFYSYYKVQQKDNILQHSKISSSCDN